MRLEVLYSPDSRTHPTTSLSAGRLSCRFNNNRHGEYAAYFPPKWQPKEHIAAKRSSNVACRIGRGFSCLCVGYLIFSVCWHSVMLAFADLQVPARPTPPLRAPPLLRREATLRASKPRQPCWLPSTPPAPQPAPERSPPSVGLHVPGWPPPRPWPGLRRPGAHGDGTSAGTCLPARRCMRNSPYTLFSVVLASLHSDACEPAMLWLHWWCLWTSCRVDSCVGEIQRGFVAVLCVVQVRRGYSAWV